MQKANLSLSGKGHNIYYSFPGGSYDITQIKRTYNTGLRSQYCAFGESKLKCFQVNKKKTDLYYGPNLIFVQPIARQPDFYRSSRIEGHREPVDWVELAKSQEWVDKQKDFEIYKYAKNELNQINNVKKYLGQYSENEGYSPVGNTIGGEYVLSIWQSLIGRIPTRKCSIDNPCSVVVEGTISDKKAIMYCSILNTEIGLGLPYSCNLVAYAQEGQWFVYAIGGPEQCDGCGGASGIQCYASTDESLDVIADRLIDLLKVSKTNIEQKILSKKLNSIRLGGKKIATDSKFFSGYYEKAYAIYEISIDDSNKKSPSVALYGVFNLLISSEPSIDSVNYRDFTSRLEENGKDWFQDRMLEIIDKGLFKKLSKEAMCSNDGVD